MNKKTLVIIISSLCVLVIIGIIIALIVTKKDKTFVIDFISDDVVYKELKFSCGKQIKLPFTPSKEGYVFKNWVNSDNNIVLDGALLECEDIELYAKWEEEVVKKESFKVMFDTDSDTIIDSIELKCNERITLPENPVKDGFEFVGWYNNDMIVMDGTLLNCEDVTLKANWATKTYKVTFDSNGGTNTSSINVECGNVLKLPNNPYRKDYKFVSWVDKNGNKVSDGDLLTCEDILLKATWEEEIKYYKVTFDSKGGSSVDSINVECGKELKLPDKPTKNGYNFISWLDNNDKAILDGALLSCEDLTLYAKWEEEIKYYKVTFDSKGGSSVDSINVECGKELKLPSNPTKDGYTFISWIDNNGTPILDGAKLTCENVTLYANWNQNE